MSPLATDLCVGAGLLFLLTIAVAAVFIAVFSLRIAQWIAQLAEEPPVVQYREVAPPPDIWGWSKNTR